MKLSLSTLGLQGAEQPGAVSAFTRTRPAVVLESGPEIAQPDLLITIDPMTDPAEDLIVQFTIDNFATVHTQVTEDLDLQEIEGEDIAYTMVALPNNDYFCRVKTTLSDWSAWIPVEINTAVSVPEPSLAFMGHGLMIYAGSTVNAQGAGFMVHVELEDQDPGIPDDPTPQDFVMMTSHGLAIVSRVTSNVVALNAVGMY